MAYASWTGGSGAGLPYDDQAMQELLQKFSSQDGSAPGTGPGMGDAGQAAQGAIGGNGILPAPGLASAAQQALRFPTAPGQGVPRAGPLSPAAMAAQGSVGGGGGTPGSQAGALARGLPPMPMDPSLQPSKGQPPMSPDEDPNQQTIYTGSAHGMAPGAGRPVGGGPMRAKGRVF